MPQKTPTTLQERLAKAIETNTYCKIHNNKWSQVKISGAARAWNEKNVVKPEVYNQVYIPDLRLCGVVEDLSAVMKANGYDDKQIREFLKVSYSREILGHPETPIAKQYAREVAAFTSASSKKEKKPRSEPVFKLSDVPALYKAVVKNKATTTIATAKRFEGLHISDVVRAEVDSSKKGTHRGLKASLEGGVLLATEVYNVSTSTPGKVRYRKMSKPSSASKFKMVEGLSVVSETYEAYRAAMEELGAAYLHFADKYNEQHVLAKTIEKAAEKTSAKPEEAADVKPLRKLPSLPSKPQDEEEFDDGGLPDLAI